jgi:hypothetical protein
MAACPSGILRVVTLSLRLEPELTFSCPSLAVLPAPTGKPFALIRELLTTIRDPVTFVRDSLALIRHPLALAHVREHRRVRVRMAGVTPAVQPDPLARQVRIIASELRLPAHDLRPEPLGLEPPDSIPLLEPFRLQTMQIGPVALEVRECTLETGAPPLELSPLLVANRIPSRGRRFITCRALLMLRRRPDGVPRLRGRR